MVPWAALQQVFHIVKVEIIRNKISADQNIHY